MGGTMDIIKQLADELSIKPSQVEKTVLLIDEGNTIPFIARYRKEITGNLSDETLRELEARLQYLRNLKERIEDVIRLVDEQGKMTPQLKEKMLASKTLQTIEDYYLPYKPKKRTRAMIAKERGLQVLADEILSGASTEEKMDQTAESLLGKEVESIKEAYSGACDILAEMIADDIECRDLVRNNLINHGGMSSSPGKAEDEEGVYRMYYQFAERIKNLKPHRILAMARGEKEGKLKIRLEADDQQNIEKIRRKYIEDTKNPSFAWLDHAVRDSYKRLLYPSIETEMRSALKKMADEASIKVFGQNLKPTLMQSPIRGRVVMGLDPGFRTGCKVAVVSEHGEVLDYTTIYPVAPKNRVAESEKILREKIDRYGVTLITIGNGTASRETEQFVVDMIKKIDDDIFYTIVNESGASIYSASKLGQEEFPDLDVTIRGAISIARRIQDPMAELVKIEPKHIGVGQYQHDVDQKALDGALEKVVEDCVNQVGVDINTASGALLGYVSGISKKIAENIILYKRENGPFQSRKEIKKVGGIGPKTLVQCAGFLRVPESKEPLDHTGVHPESYDIARMIMKEDLEKINFTELAKTLQVGEPTLRDIVEELKKPGRDPREDLPEPILRSDVLSIDDLQVGMELMGTVRNVVDFGAFVDIGIKNDGLVHISELSQKFIRNASDVVKVSDIVKVKIIGVDTERGKVSLSMKGLN